MKEVEQTYQASYRTHRLQCNWLCLCEAVCNVNSVVDCKLVFSMISVKLRYMQYQF